MAQRNEIYQQKLLNSRTLFSIFECDSVDFFFFFKKNIIKGNLEISV